MGVLALPISLNVSMLLLLLLLLLLLPLVLLQLVQGAAEFTTSARVLMVMAVAEHNAALVVDGGHPGFGTPNWEMTQWQGLVASCVSFPELYNASGHLAVALSYLDSLLVSGVYPGEWGGGAGCAGSAAVHPKGGGRRLGPVAQRCQRRCELLPLRGVIGCQPPPPLPPCSSFRHPEPPCRMLSHADGVETEQASGYDMVTAGDFFSTLELLSKAGQPPPPASFSSHVEQMWDYGERRGCSQGGRRRCIVMP
jgi:hypothetical protein